MTMLAATLGRIAEVRSLVGDLSLPPVGGPSGPAPAPGGEVRFADALVRFGAEALGAPAPPLIDGDTTSVDGQRTVDAARRYLGVPYVFGGEDESGMDCSGLVQRVFADLGIAVPRIVPDQAVIGVEVPSLDQARPGDLIITRDRGHIVIYAGDGMIIHAPRPGKSVEIVPNYLSPADIGTIRRVSGGAPA